MDPKNFQPGFPGILIATTGWDLRVHDGIPEKIPVRGMAFVPKPLPPTINPALSRELDHQAFIGSVSEDLLVAQANLARLEGSVGALPNADLLLRPFRYREAQLSSKIEDTFATVEEVALVEADHLPEHGHAREVWNYVEALEHGLDSDLPLSTRLFKELHGTLMSGVRGEDKRPGEFRTIQVCIGDEKKGFASARFVPPPPGDVLNHCLSELERFLNPGYRKSPDELGTPRFPSLIEIAMAHYQFECIHPFSDGNGRLGRLLISLALCKGALISRPLVYVSAYFEKHRQEYYDLLLRVSTQGDWGSWVRFFCRAVATQADDAIGRATKLGELRQKYVRAVTRKRTSALVVQLIDLLFVQPVVQPPLLARRLKVAVQTGQKHINRLVESGILVEVTGGNYGRRYLAREILQVVEAD